MSKMFKYINIHLFMKRQKAKYVLLKHLIYLEEESVTIFFHLAFSNLDHTK